MLNQLSRDIIQRVRALKQSPIQAKARRQPTRPKVIYCTRYNYDVPLSCRFKPFLCETAREGKKHANEIIHWKISNVIVFHNAQIFAISCKLLFFMQIPDIPQQGRCSVGFE